MDFVTVVDQVIALLRQRGRVAYRTLKRQFQLDDEALEDLKIELIDSQRLATDEQGTVLVWTGAGVVPPAASAGLSGTVGARPPLAYTPPYLAEKILTSRTALEGERKLVTVLFADLKGSTELIRDLDHEAVQTLLDPALHRMMDAVHRFEGTVNDVAGDGIMAMFGAPIAHEDHTLRACNAALAMQAALRRDGEEVRRRQGLEVLPRIGLNSGGVLVRTIGNDLYMNYSGVGLTTHLPALAHLPERHETLAQAIDLRLDLRNALLPLDEQERLLEHLRAADPLAERLGDPQRLGLSASSLVFSFTVMGEHERAIATGQRALALATTSGAFDVQVNVQSNLSTAYYAAGDYRQALDVAQRMMAVLTGEILSERFGLPISPGLLGRGYVALCLAELGDFAAGAGIGEEAIRLAEAVAQPNSMVIVLCRVGLCYRRQGVLQKAIPMLERGLALSQSTDIRLQFPMTASILSAAYALAGRTAEALPLLDQMLERVATGRRTLLHALVLTELSEACLLVGRVDEASTLAARLLELSHTHTGPGYQAHACRLLGEVARRRQPPDIDQAATYYRQALTLAEELGMRPLQAHCHLEIGTLFATAGQAEQARAELSTALAMYQAMAMTFWLPETEAALTQVERR